MIKPFIDKDYMSTEYGLKDYENVVNSDYYIKRASRKIAQLITNDQFDEDDITNLTQKQQDAIKEATAIYADYYWKDDFDFTEGNISVNIGSNNFSESRVYNGEKVIPQTLELLQNQDLLETDFGSFLAVDVDLDGGDILNPSETGVIDDSAITRAEGTYE